MKKKTTPAATPAEKKKARFTVNSVSYALGFDFNRVCEVEPEAGCNLLSGLGNMANLSMGQLRGLLCAAIRAGNPKSTITVAEVGALLKFDTIFPATEALAESILFSAI